MQARRQSCQRQPHTSSKQSLDNLMLIEGQAKAWRQRTLDAAKGPICWRRLASTGYCARQPGKPERILTARQHLLQFEVCVLGLKPVIARVRLQCLTNLLSAGAWPASSCMRVTLEFFQEHAPSVISVTSVTRDLPRACSLQTDQCVGFQNLIALLDTLLTHDDFSCAPSGITPSLR